ncbi:hypothetical protein EV356DRAFT_455768, partial [Viridothelium virens]
DEQSSPPTCCHNPIPMEMADQFLAPELKSQFLKKATEYSTVDRTYCYQPTCSAFIPKTNIKGGVATCPDCKSTTCPSCKREMHEKDDCSEDPAVQSVMRIAEEEGWRRCTECGRMVELIVGCYHVSCYCGNGFCYICGARWKSCSCPQADKGRVVFRAQRDGETAARNQRAAAAAARAQEVEQQQSACDHARGAGTWARAEGGACRMCRRDNPWLMQCPRCSIRICRSCRLTKVN